MAPSAFHEFARLLPAPTGPATASMDAGDNLFAVTSLTGRVEEVITINLDQAERTIPLSYMFCDECEPDTLVPVSVVGQYPVRLGAIVVNRHLTVSVDPQDLEKHGGRMQVYVKVSGIRKGFR